MVSPNLTKKYHKICTIDVFIIFLKINEKNIDSEISLFRKESLVFII
jgi:hypothetical protein